MPSPRLIPRTVGATGGITGWRMLTMAVLIVLALGHMSSLPLGQFAIGNNGKSSSFAALNASHDVPFSTNNASSFFTKALSISPTSLIPTKTKNDGKRDNDGPVTKESFSEVMKATIRLLYDEKSKHRKQLLESTSENDDYPLLPQVYIYETLAQDWSNVTLISECIDRHFLQEGVDVLSNWTNCRWYPHICNDKTGPMGGISPKYMTYRYNFISDVAWVEWFNRYPRRVYNASDADLFLIPYPHWSHCICYKNFDLPYPTCPHKMDAIQTNVVEKLSHYNQNRAKHLWILGTDWGVMGPSVRNGLFSSSLSLSLGPGVEGCGNSYTKKPCGHFTAPYLNTNREYQPNVLMEQPWWYDNYNYVPFGETQALSSRPFSLGSVLGTPGSLKMRADFAINFKTYLGDPTKSSNGNDDDKIIVGGLPIKFVNLGEERIPLALDAITDVYRQSMFCPVFPGDGPAQKRFFDVILNGCIPLVPAWPTYGNNVSYANYTAHTTSKLSQHHFSFWRHGSQSVEGSYPYSLGSFWGDEEKAVGIDYLSDLVVVFDGFCGLSCMKGAMENVLANETRLLELQKNLKKYAVLFGYGLDDNMHRHVDGFSASFVSILHYLRAVP